MTKEDRRTGRQTGKKGGGWGKRELGAGDVLAGALAHVPCCHTKGVSPRVGLKDGGGGRGRGEAIKGFFFFFFPRRWWPVVPRTAQPGLSQPTQRGVRGRGN